MIIYSFDVFDTVLTRKVATPRDVFYAFLNESQIELRLQAERDARKISIYKDVTLEEIWTFACMNFPDAFPFEVSSYVDTEMKAEWDCVYGVPEILDKIDEVRKAGYKILYVSDMYLSSDFIRDLLGREGVLFDDSEIFVSSEMNRAKWDGSMWQYLRERFGKNTIIHTGDNIVSDVKMAKRYGVETVYFTDCHLVGSELDESLDTRERGKLRYLRLYNPYPKGTYNRDLYEVGTIAGPLMWEYARWLVDTLRDQKIQRTYCFARDCYILIDMLRKLCPEIDHRYFYCSRFATYFMKQRDDNAWVFDNELVRTLVSAPRKYARDRLKTKNIESDIKKRSDEQTLELHKYCVTSGLYDDEKMMFVDLGWHGTVQDKICRQILHRDVPLSMLFESNAFPSMRENYVFHECKIDMDMINLTEMLFCAPESTVKGYWDGHPILSEVMSGMNPDVWDAYYKGVMASEDIVLGLDDAQKLYRNFIHEKSERKKSLLKNFIVNNDLVEYHTYSVIYRYSKWEFVKFFMKQSPVRWWYMAKFHLFNKGWMNTKLLKMLP